MTKDRQGRMEKTGQRCIKLNMIMEQAIVCAAVPITLDYSSHATLSFGFTRMCTLSQQIYTYTPFANMYAYYMICIIYTLCSITNQFALVIKNVCFQNAVGGRQENGEGEGQEVGIEILNEIRVSLYCRPGSEVDLSAKAEFCPSE